LVAVFEVILDGLGRKDLIVVADYICVAGLYLTPERTPTGMPSGKILQGTFRLAERERDAKTVGAVGEQI
jgi:hypothetical protein